MNQGGRRFSIGGGGSRPALRSALAVPVLFVAAVLLGAPRPAAAAEAAGSVGALGEVDTNPRRRTTQKNGDASFVPTPDLLVRAVAEGRASHAGKGYALSAQGALGAKLFFRERSERMVAGQAQLNLTVPILNVATLRSFWSGKARTQVSGARTYTGQQVGADLFVPVYGPLTLRTTTVGSLFLSLAYPQFSNVALSESLGAVVSVTEKESILLSAGVTVRPYPALGRLDFVGETVDSRRRLDMPLVLSLTVNTSRAVFGTAGYTLLRNVSNSRGESYTRHRAFIYAGTRLPMDIVASMQASLQFTRYDDGVSVGNSLILADDDESQNSAQVSLSREWWFGIHTEARFAWYGNELAREGVQFQRVTSGIGLRKDL